MTLFVQLATTEYGWAEVAREGFADMGPFEFVHRSEKPLASASLRPEDDGQLALECEGMCGV